MTTPHLYIPTKYIPRLPALTIATNALNRYLRERESYVQEIATQEEKIKELKQRFERDGDGDGGCGNAGFLIRQEQHSHKQSLAIIPVLNDKIRAQVIHLKEEMAKEGCPRVDVVKAQASLTRAGEVFRGVEGEGKDHGLEGDGEGVGGWVWV